jgi:hypothetical protein
VAFACSIFIYPPPCWVSLTTHCPAVGELRAYHVPRGYHTGEGSACPPVTVGLRQASEKRRDRSRTFWFKPVSIFGLLTVTTFMSGSRRLARTIDPSPQLP